MTIQLEHLKSTPYFAGLSDDELASIRKFVSEKASEKGEVLLIEGESAASLYFVISGVVKIFKTSSDGKEQILFLVRPGESLNDVPIFSDGPSPLSAEAMGPVLLYSIKRSDFMTILSENPRVALNAVQVLSRRVHQLVSLIEDLSFKPVTGRVAKMLLENAENGPEQGPKLTQQEMAAMAGTAREMVGRALRTLEEEGAIRIDRHRIVIADKEALRRMAK